MRGLVLRGSASATAVILTIWGYIEFANFLFDRLPLYWALGVSGLILVLVVAAIFASPAFRLLRYVGARPFVSERVYTEYKRYTKVGSNLRAEVRVCRDIVFLADPRKRDLWDVFSVAPNQSLSQFRYVSPDAVELERRQKRRNRLVVFWKPRVSIIPRMVYRHETVSEPPVTYNDRAIYSEFHCLGDVGVFEETIVPPFQAIEAIGFPRPFLRRLKNEDALITYALDDGRSIVCAQPTIDLTGVITWRIEGPSRGRSYVLVVLSAEGLADARSALERHRAKRWFRRQPGRERPSAG